MQVELQALWTEQSDQLKKKKEQYATEVSKTSGQLTMYNMKGLTHNSNTSDNNKLL